MASECGRNAQQIVSYRDIHFLTLIFNSFSIFLANLIARFASRCSGFGHGRLGKTPLVSGPGVAHKFRKARVTGDGPDLVRGSAGFG